MASPPLVIKVNQLFHTFSLPGVAAKSPKSTDLATSIMQSSEKCTHLVRVAAKEQQVEGYGRHQIDQEPSLEVVHCYTARMGDDLVISANVRGPEIDQDVDDEGHVH